MTIALVADAIVDPAIGYFSDNLRTRWGRRHPLMYATALPYAAVYFLLWNPPAGWPDEAMFWWILGLTMLIRMISSSYETPSSALAPELTADYDGRSTLFSYRLYFGWTGGNLMSVLLLGVIAPLFATAAQPNGLFTREAFAAFGIVGSCLLLVSILVSAAGTHDRIRYLPPPPAKRSLSLGRIFREIFDTLATRSFIALFLAAMLGSIATGLSAALSFFFGQFFWGFTSQQQTLITASVFGSAVIGALLAPWATRVMGKKRAAISIGLVAFLGAPLPIVLRLFDLLPPNGDPFLFWFIFVTTLVDVGLIICFQIVSTSMLADLVEPAALKTGRRSEGVFFASSTFIQQAVQGIGVIAASLALEFAGIPAGASPAQVPPEALWRLGALYVPLILSIWLAMIAVIASYRLTRADHEENVRRLAASGG
jgi:Na+/melibiose symporter-like transporter